MRVLIGYLINGKSSGIDKYVLRMLDTLQDQKIQFDCLTTEKTEGTGRSNETLWGEADRMSDSEDTVETVSIFSKSDRETAL